MGIKTVEARDEDMDRIFQVACDAFGRNEPMWDVMYPKHWLAEGRAKGADKMRKTNRADPCTKFMYVRHSSLSVPERNGVGFKKGRRGRTSADFFD